MLSVMDSLGKITTPAASSALSVAKSTKATLGHGKLQEACEDFESLLLGQMITKMRESIPDDGLLPRSQGEKIFQEMLDNEYAKEMSRSQTVGLAAMLYRQLGGDMQSVQHAYQSQALETDSRGDISKNMENISVKR